MSDNQLKISEESLSPFLLYNDPIPYSDNITIHPVKMKDILLFHQFVSAITIRKDSVFPVKSIIKMTYLDFIFYCHEHPELATEYKILYLPYLFAFSFNLLKLVCVGQTVDFNPNKRAITINGEEITAQKFDDIRRIIMIQNNVDFDMDEFMHYDTEQELLKAQEYESKKNKEKYSIEDYIDSLIISMKVTEDYIKNLTIRKFWRYIKRISKHENYQLLQSAAYSGMVTFKEPIQYWMSSIDNGDKFANVKADENELRSKVSG